MRLSASRRIQWILIAVIMAVAVIVIERRVPARIDLNGSTLIINGFEPVSAGARLINRHGDSIWHSGLRYHAPEGSIVHATDDGAVRCSGVGDDIVAVTKGRLRENLVVRCRPIAMFGLHGVAQGLYVGGPPRELVLSPLGFDKKPVELLQGRATVRDTSVAELRDNMLYPKRLGSTYIDVEFSGGVSTRVYVGVSRLAIDSTLSLVPSELESWHVVPGYYHLTLTTSDSLSSDPALVVAVINANCAKGREGPQDLYCITKDNSSIVVRNIRPAGTGGRAVGRLRASQVPHASANSQPQVAAR